MKNNIKFLLLIFTISCIAQNNGQKNDLFGKFYSKNNGFEKWSIVELKKDGRFIYNYGLSACQAEITGTYIVVNKRIIFKNDLEFLNDKIDELSPFYPDMSLTKWKIKKNFIKPENVVDSGCIKDKGKHFKK